MRSRITPRPRAIPPAPSPEAGHPDTACHGAPSGTCCRGEHRRAVDGDSAAPGGHRSNRLRAGSRSAHARGRSRHSPLAERRPRPAKARNRGRSDGPADGTDGVVQRPGEVPRSVERGRAAADGRCSGDRARTGAPPGRLAGQVGGQLVRPGCELVDFAQDGSALSPDLRGDTTSAKTFWWGLTDSDRWFARACTASRSRNTPGTRSATPRLSFRPSSFPTGRFAKPGARDEVRVLPSCRAHVLVLHRQGAARLRRSTAGSHSPGAATLPRLAGANRGDHRAYAGGGEWPSRRRRARSARGMGRAV